MNQFHVWKTIELGVPIMVNSRHFPNYQVAVENAYIPGSSNVSWIPSQNHAKKLLTSPLFTVNANRREVDLIKTKVTGLGFGKDDNPTLQRLYSRAKELGLELCPAEVGPKLYIQAVHDHSWGRIMVGMEPINTGGEVSVFAMTRDPCFGGLTIFSMGGLEIPNLVWSDYYDFTFVLPRSSRK